MNRFDAPLKRYTSINFPDYAHRPGETPHPNKSDGHQFKGIKLSVAALDEDNYAHNEAYLYAVDLFNHKFFWEAHVWWEELWHLCNETESVRKFLQGLIMISASCLKLNLQQPAPALQLLTRALELIGDVKNRRVNCIMGVSLDHLLQLNIAELQKSEGFQIKLVGID